MNIPHHSNTKCQKMEQFDSLKEVCITVLLTSRNEISMHGFFIITNNYKCWVNTFYKFEFSYPFKTILLWKLLVTLCVPATAMAAT